MDKNTIIAIILSALVIVGSCILMPIFFPGLYGAQSSGDVVETETTEAENLDEFMDSENEFVDAAETETVESEIIPEQTITIKTSKAEIVLTNKGGDIISYTLNDFQDKDTNSGVQISDNVWDKNRTCAIALGDSSKPIFNETMSVEKIDDYTILFRKNVTVGKGSEKKSFMYGKKYSFKKDENVFKVDVMFHSNEDLSFLNDNGASYTIRTSPQIGPHFNPKENKYENRQYITYNGKKMKRLILGTNQFKRNEKQKDFIWSAIAGKYFAEIMIPLNPGIMNAGFYSSMIEVNNYANAQSLVERKMMSGTDISDTYYFYFGPRDEKELKKYNSALDGKGEPQNDWGIGGYKLTEVLQSSSIFGWLEKILKVALELIYKVVKNWGVAIIILTICLKLIMFPLSKKQSMSTLKMQDLQPKIQAVQEKYKDNPQQQQAALAKIYKEADYNPASGCLPMLFQFLILFAMYNLFNYKFEFYQAMFIPKWIPDLSAGDSVYKFTFNIPLLGNQLRILPIIYVVTQLLFGKITQYGGSTAGQAQNAGTMKFMMYGMPLIFFFLFYNAPSGLLIYWIVSNAFQMVQQIIINKFMAKKKIELQNEKNGGAKQKVVPPKVKKRK